MALTAKDCQGPRAQVSEIYQRRRPAIAMAKKKEPNYPILTTKRLRLRPWRESDLEFFAELNADPRVMEFYPKVLDRTESDAAAARVRDHFKRNGYGLWAVEVPGVADFIGYVGLSIPGFKTAFTPCVEVGWRLAHRYWGGGYASEAAHAVLWFGFEELGLDEIVSFTVPANLRSRKVMERIGMKHDPSEDFNHPVLPLEHPLNRHVLYRLSRNDWLSQLPPEARPPVARQRATDVACLWRWLQGTGLERCVLSKDGAGWRIRGSIITLVADEPAQLDYRIYCKKSWKTSRAEIKLVSGSVTKTITIEVERGRWICNKKEVKSVRGCLDLDIGWTPSTNTLPIRRLDLAVGESSGPLTAAWLRLPELELEPLPQEYKRLSERTYLYTSRDGSFKAHLDVDRDGLVVEYEGFWQRVKGEIVKASSGPQGQ